MKKKRDLTQVTRAQVAILYEEGYSQREVAARLKVSRGAVQKAIKRFQETGKHTNRPKSGRPKVLTPREKRLLVSTSLKKRMLTSKKLTADFNARHKKSISPSTVRSVLNEAGLRGCKARKKPWLSEKNKRSRYEWAKNHESWTAQDYDNIIWSDESNIEVS